MAGIPTQLDAIDPATLTPLVRLVTGRDGSEAVDWQIQALHGGGEALSRLYRVVGRARDGAATLSWSLVLKVMRASPEREDPQHWNYWKREFLAYQSGLLDHLPGGLHAPGCFGAVQPTSDTAWLWLEELVECAGSPWPVSAYGLAARHLGGFNGAYLAGRPVPKHAWLRVDWLRSYVNDYAPAVARLPHVLDHPLVRRLVSRPSAAAFIRLLEERETFLKALDRLPQTLCHRDAWRPNLFMVQAAGGEDRTVAVDWAFVGVGAVGQDLAPLVVWNDQDPSAREEVEEMVVGGYLQGLHDAGWHADPRMVRLGYTAAAALTYGLATLGWYLGLLLDESQHAWAEESTGRPIEEGLEGAGGGFEFILSRAEEARQLMSTVR